MQVFQTALERWGEYPPAGEWETLVKGGTFSSGGGNLSRSDFDHLNCFEFFLVEEDYPGLARMMKF